MKRNFKYLALVLTLLLGLISFCGCDDVSDYSDYNDVYDEEYYSDYDEDYDEGYGAGVQESPISDYSPEAPSISLSEIPAYSGSAFVAINGNHPYFTEEDYTTSAFERYSSLDSLGRCGVAYANICTTIMPTGERESIGSVKPTGWHSTRYNGVVEGNYLYNRCHLIGYQLAGENANERNLITGTRYLNMEGMLPFENMVDDYVEETNNHVLYRVTPIFEGSNLVASGVLMEGRSVEDRGRGIEFCVYCYNVQPGVAINYATGDSSLSQGGAQSSQSSSQGVSAAAATAAGAAAGSSSQSSSSSSSSGQSSSGASASGGSSQSSASADYVGNVNTLKFHHSWCGSVKKMNEGNKIFFSSRDEALSKGYDPCGNCNP